MALQHLRSGTANKRPLPTAMSDGQIAVNTNLASPGLFFKDSNGDLVKVGPVHIGSTAPNASPASTAATALVANTIYKILTVGTSDFTAVGASSNAVGVVFTASGTTTGTGTVSGEQGNEKGEMWLDNTGGAYDLKIYDGTAWRSQAGEFVNATGDTMTGDLLFNNANIVFEGSSADDHETTLTVANPTADRTITLPNVSGTVVTTGDTGSVTSTMLTDGTIVNADINASAAIAGTKISPDFGSQNVVTTGSGRLLVGTSSLIDSSTASTFQIANASGPRLTIGRNDTSVTDGNLMGAIDFYGNDSDGTYQECARILAEADGTHSTSDKPTRLTLHTAEFGVTGAQERVRITSNGLIGINENNPGHYIDMNIGSTDVGIKMTSSDAGAYIQFADNATSGELSVGAEGSNLVAKVSGSERLRIDSSGRVGIGVAPSTFDGNGDNLVISSSGATGITIDATSSTNSSIHFADGSTGNEAYRGYLVYSHSSDAMLFATSATEAMRIDSSGRLLINHTADTAPASYASKLQLCDTSYQGSSLLIRRDQDSSSAPTLLFTKTRSSSKGGSTVVQNGDLTGQIIFFAGDGTDSNCMTAYIQSAVDGTPGSNDMPGRLSFHTTSDGSTSSTERLRIDSSGRVGIGVSSLSSSSRLTLLESAGNGQTLEIKGANTGGVGSQPGIKFTASTGDNIGGIFGDTNSDAVVLQSGGTERMRIDSSGRVAIGTTTIADAATALVIKNTASGNEHTLLDIVCNTNETARVRFSEDGSSFPGEVKYDTLNNFLSFNANSAERMRIDSSGRLLVGTTTEGSSSADDLTLATSGHTGITVRSGSSSDGNIFFSRGTSGNDELKGYIQYNHASDFMRFATAHTERMRIDSSGAVTVKRASTYTTGLQHGLAIQQGSATNGNRAGLVFKSLDGYSVAGINGVISTHSGTQNNNVGYLEFYTKPQGVAAPTERMRIDSSGLVGIGTSSPAEILHCEKSAGVIKVSSSSDNKYAALYAGDSSYDSAVLWQNGALRFYNTSERMRIGSSGIIHFGSTAVTHPSYFFAPDGGGGTFVKDTNSTASRTAFIFRILGTQVGSITTSGSATAYNESSDYRLKENVVDITDGITRVKQLQPRRFNFIADADTTVDGFIAHEAQAIVPQAVTGTKDEVDDDGNPVMQGIDKSKLVPLLTAALQEAIAKIETLEQRLSDAGIA